MYIRRASFGFSATELSARLTLALTSQVPRKVSGSACTYVCIGGQASGVLAFPLRNALVRAWFVRVFCARYGPRSSPRLAKIDLAMQILVTNSLHEFGQIVFHGLHRFDD